MKKRAQGADRRIHVVRLNLSRVELDALREVAEVKGAPVAEVLRYLVLREWIAQDDERKLRVLGPPIQRPFSVKV